MSFALPEDMFSYDTENAFARKIGETQDAMAGMAGSTVNAMAQREKAKAYAEAYQEERDRQIAAAKAAQSRSTLGAGLGVVSSIVGALPFVGPVAKAAISGGAALASAL